MSGDVDSLITTATEDIVPSIAGIQNDKVNKINNFLRDKCHNTGARFVDNDENFLFRDGFCDVSSNMMVVVFLLPM